MAFFDLFRKRRSKPEAATDDLAFTFCGGKGTSAEDAIIVFPRRLDELRRMFQSTVESQLPPELCADKSALDGAIAETLKMMYLEQLLGKEGQNWQCGPRIYLDGSKQSQGIILNDGRSMTLYFDFSPFYPHGAW